MQNVQACHLMLLEVERPARGQAKLLQGLADKMRLLVLLIGGMHIIAVSGPNKPSVYAVMPRAAAG